MNYENQYHRKRPPLHESAATLSREGVKWVAYHPLKINSQAYARIQIYFVTTRKKASISSIVHPESNSSFIVFETSTES